MAKKKTIGILNALVTADGAQLRKEFSSIDNTIRRSTTKWQKGLKDGLKLGAGVVGAQAGLGALTAEIQRVIQNVERIPGINPMAVASIVEARTEFSKLRNVVDGGIASLLSYGIDFGKSVGAGAAMLMGADGDAVAEGLSKQETPDEVAAGKDDQYYEKVAAARSKLVEAQKKAGRASMTDAEEIVALREEAAKLEKFSSSASIDSLQQLEAQTAAEDKTTAANAKLTAMKKQLTEAEKELSKSLFGSAVAKLSDAERTDLLKAKAMGLQVELATLYRLLKEHPDDPAYLQQQIDKTKELTETNKQLEKVYDKLVKAGESFGNQVASSFEDAVFAGEDLKDTVRALLNDLGKSVFHSLITDGLGKSIGGGIKSMIGSIFGFAEGGRPPVGRPSVVGEAGPELFVPDTAGTIVPNHALQDSGGKGGGGNFYIDARGADQTGLARLEAMIRSINASIETRAVGAMQNFRLRGASFA